MTLCIIKNYNNIKYFYDIFHLDDSIFVVAVLLCSRKAYMSGILVLPLSGA
jgi:hypothetical protein